MHRAMTALAAARLGRARLDSGDAREHVEKLASRCWSGSRRSPSRGTPGGSRSPRCLLDCPHHEYRRKSVDGSGVLPRLLRSHDLALSWPLVCSGRVLDDSPVSRPGGERPDPGACHRHSLLRRGERRGHERQSERLFARRECRRADRFRREPNRQREFWKREPRERRGPNSHRVEHSRRDRLRDRVDVRSLQHRVGELVHARRTRSDSRGDGALHPDHIRHSERERQRERGRRQRLTARDRHRHRRRSGDDAADRRDHVPHPGHNVQHEC